MHFALGVRLLGLMGVSLSDGEDNEFRVKILPKNNF